MELWGLDFSKLEELVYVVFKVLASGALCKPCYSY